MHEFKSALEAAFGVEPVGMAQVRVDQLDGRSAGAASAHVAGCGQICYCGAEQPARATVCGCLAERPVMGSICRVEQPVMGSICRAEEPAPTCWCRVEQPVMGSICRVEQPVPVAG